MSAPNINFASHKSPNTNEQRVAPVNAAGGSQGHYCWPLEEYSATFYKRLLASRSHVEFDDFEARRLCLSLAFATKNA